MGRPIIFLSFANSREKHLPLLDSERQSILKSLLPLEDKDFFSIRHESAINRDILQSYLTDYRDRIVLFHYAGHAGSDRIITSGGDSLVGGLAELLGSMPELQCVFLNGCNTEEQTKLLLDAGVPAVIGTSSPISDNIATEFSKAFYSSLANGNSIERAYKDARAAVLLSRQTDQIPERGERYAGNLKRKTWGLLYTDQAASDWKLPVTPYVRTVIVPNEVHEGVDKNQAVNVVLRQKMFEALAPYDSFLQFSWEQQKQGEEIELRIIQQKIIDALPVPLGQEVRRIFSSSELSIERLKVFVRAYRSLLQLITYTLLAQLWDILYSHPDHPLDEQLRSSIKKFLATEDDNRSFDVYVSTIRSLRIHFNAANVPLFIDEMEDISERFYSSLDMQKAHQWLEWLRSNLEQNSISNQDLESVNNEAEKNLGMMFQQLGIVCRYKFVTIKDIDLVKRRHKEPEYRIQKVSLDRLTAGLMDELKTGDSFTDNHAVILLKSAKNFDDYLNLSPFLIDEHALLEKMQKSKLFMFSSFNEETGQLNYHLVLENIPHAELNTAIYPLVEGEFAAFRKAVFG